MHRQNQQMIISQSENPVQILSRTVDKQQLQIIYLQDNILFLKQQINQYKRICGQQQQTIQGISSRFKELQNQNTYLFHLTNTINRQKALSEMQLQNKTFEFQENQTILQRQMIQYHKQTMNLKVAYSQLQYQHEQLMNQQHALLQENQALKLEIEQNRQNLCQMREYVENYQKQWQHYRLAMEILVNHYNSECNKSKETICTMKDKISNMAQEMTEIQSHNLRLSSDLHSKQMVSLQNKIGYLSQDIGNIKHHLFSKPEKLMEYYNFKHQNDIMIYDLKRQIEEKDKIISRYQIIVQNIKARIFNNSVVEQINSQLRCINSFIHSLLLDKQAALSILVKKCGPTFWELFYNERRTVEGADKNIDLEKMYEELEMVLELYNMQMRNILDIIEVS